eukprot:Rmarinus@m.14718
MSLCAYFGALRNEELRSIRACDVKPSESSFRVSHRLFKASVTSKDFFYLPYEFSDRPSGEISNLIQSYLRLCADVFLQNENSPFFLSWNHQAKKFYDPRGNGTGKNRLSEVAKSIAVFNNLPLARYSSHSFKRSSVSKIGRVSGIDSLEVAAIAHHSDPRTTVRYFQNSEDVKSRAVSSLMDKSSSSSPVCDPAPAASVLVSNSDPVTGRSPIVASNTSSSIPFVSVCSNPAGSAPIFHLTRCNVYYNASNSHPS